MCEIGTRKRPHFQQEGGPFFCRMPARDEGNVWCGREKDRWL